MNKYWFIFFFLLNRLLNLYANTSQFTLSYRDDPATTVTIGWSGDEGQVYFGNVDFGNNYLNYPNSVSIDRSGTAHGLTRHFVRLTGLTPNTIYYFVVRDINNQTSSRYYFRTLSDDENVPLSFISGGDTRDGFKLLGIYIEDCPSGDCREMRRKGNQMVAKLRPDFVAFNGDFVMNQITSNTTQEWNNWLDEWQLTITDDGRLFPMTFTQGNHEDNLDIYNFFDVPIEEYYALNFHNNLLRLYLLNSELNACSNAEQLNWLSQDLQNNTGTNFDPFWKFVNYHVPTYSMGNGYGLAQEQMTCWVPLFESYNVRLIMESHGHLTKWTYPCVSNSNQDDFEIDMENGIVYIGEGQWGAPHRTLDFTGVNQKSYVRDQGVFDNFFWIRVTPSQTKVQCVPFNELENILAIGDNSLGKELNTDIAVWNPSNGDALILNNELSALTNKTTNDIEVFPTLSDGKFKVEAKDNEIDQIILTNSLGKIVYNHYNKVINELNIDVGKVLSGVYYFYFISNNHVIYKQKVIIQ